ncbi:acetolactate synthase large subunit [Oharaeibacter diazotrophicus]|uniref:Acetolactate synthase-1/2/3 large subunit n=3 Tax=Oharaeibacter diazotrophicus TaxID=1920512 RepID=A0A4R6REB8_9HYPH|nr:acetolactate synthase large subunit [Oharaeibacter diazotrophicus]TDP84016.1 acetolactate synthase-1/2/3 large subunit [Oharaeibacter diazotrophicus]BBE73055.1 putative acetolactate synthase large subunit IlvX [Pleomorphomonas sp. SM30]GLS74843.1 hypothetical protein GCM10007904_01780 [Oharaeibacter diazotrophicus]
MNGAEALCGALLDGGIDVCFANPGTSEMHFVAALDRRPEMRCILGLAEGVVTAAADGYARMAGRPAAALLHLGPGLANGLANLHNARRARSPMVVVVGDHATWHVAADAPLTTDIEGLARPMSDHVTRLAPGESVAAGARRALEAARATPGIATLILPADVAWGPETAAAVAGPAPARRGFDAAAVAAVAVALADARRAGRRAGLLLAGDALRGAALADAARIAAATGARLLSEMFNARVERGAGRPAAPKVPYPVDVATGFLADLDLVVLVGARPPAGFFGYPGKPSFLARPDCMIVRLAEGTDDLPAALAALADAVDASATIPAGPDAPLPPDPADGRLDADAIAAVVARALPEGAVLVEEALTAGAPLYAATAGAAPHDLLQLTGGAIGIGIPLAAGAAVGAPGRKVVSMQADGSGMYTVQGLWTQAREGLDVVTVILSNRAYAILYGEMRGVGVAEIGRNARRMFDLDGPPLDWVALARGMGVPGIRCDDVAGFRRAFAAAVAEPGPFLIEAVL